MQKIDYLALSVAIAFGVFAGQGMYGLAKLAWAKYELRQLGQSIEQDLERLNFEQELRQQKRQRQTERQGLIRQEQLQAQRLNDKTGRNLKAQCDDWRNQLITQPTPTVEQMAREKCDQLKAYIYEGKRP